MFGKHSNTDELLALEFFSQYENIVRGGSKVKAIKSFRLFCKSQLSSISADDRVEYKKNIKLYQESLVQAKSQAVPFKERMGKEFENLNLRSLIYLLLISLVCVLSLHYVETYLTQR